MRRTNVWIHVGLILGYYNPTKIDLPLLPTEKVFMSTPIGHSRKPVLLGTFSCLSLSVHISKLMVSRSSLPPDLLLPYIASSPHRAPNMLELFARTSIQGPKAQGKEEKDGTWLSVGNEAIKFNVLDSSEEEDGIARGWLRETT